MIETRLKFKGLSCMTSSEEMAVILLTDMAEKLQVSLLCEGADIKLFERRFAGGDHRAFYLPEALLQVIGCHPEISLELHISDVVGGQYVVHLIDRNSPFRLRVNAVDAVLMSFVGDIPLYMTDRLLRTQSTPYQEGSSLISLPINIMPDAMLQKALDDAVEKENYELASHLKTEQQRRVESKK